MPVLWSVVPKDDGHHVLSKDNTLLRKDDSATLNRRLWFINQEEADAYAESLAANLYKAEDFWTVYFTCPYCGTPMDAMCTIGQEESTDGHSHTLFSCPECLRDWDYTIDNETIITYQRKFWG